MKNIYNTEYDFEQAKKDYIENCENNEPSDDTIYQFINDSVNIWFDDEKANLDVMTSNGENILAVASIGRWDGRKSGYKELGNKLNDIFSVWESCDDIKIYVENGNVKGKGYHHDGINYVTFRKWASNVSDAIKEKTLNALYMGSDKASYFVKKYTKSLSQDVAKVYGW